MTVEEAIATLQKKGSVRLDDPYGEGFYTVLVEGDRFYGMPSLYWKGKEQEDQYVHDTHKKYGRLVPWVANWQGNRYAFDHYEEPEQDNLALARIVIGVILSGRRLKIMTCGDTVSAMNKYP